MSLPRSMVWSSSSTTSNKSRNLARRSSLCEKKQDRRRRRSIVGADNATVGRDVEHFKSILSVQLPDRSNAKDRIKKCCGGRHPSRSPCDEAPGHGWPLVSLDPGFYILIPQGTLVMFHAHFHLDPIRTVNDPGTWIISNSLSGVTVKRLGRPPEGPWALSDVCPFRALFLFIS